MHAMQTWRLDFLRINIYVSEPYYFSICKPTGEPCGRFTLIRQQFVYTRSKKIKERGKYPELNGVKTEPPFTFFEKSSLTSQKSADPC